MTSLVGSDERPRECRVYVLYIGNPLREEPAPREIRRVRWFGIAWTAWITALERRVRAWLR